MNNSLKQKIYQYLKEKYPEGISSIEFDDWSVRNRITCDNSKRRLRELQKSGYIRSEWEVSPEGKRYKRYWYIPREERVVELSQDEILRFATS